MKLHYKMNSILCRINSKSKRIPSFLSRPYSLYPDRRQRCLIRSKDRLVSWERQRSWLSFYRQRRVWRRRQLVLVLMRVLVLVILSRLSLIGTRGPLNLFVFIRESVLTGVTCMHFSTVDPLPLTIIQILRYCGPHVGDHWTRGIILVLLNRYFAYPCSY